MRRVTKRGLVAALLAIPVSAAFMGAALAGDDPKTVEAVGGFEVEINKELAITFRFDDEKVNVGKGETLRFANRTVEPHTVTIADEDALPSTVDEVFACGNPDDPGPACAPALGHFTGPPDFEPIPGKEVLLDAGGPGLNAVGDSILLAPEGQDGDTQSVDVTADPGTRLHYLCAIHPWMQGEIRVKRN